MVIWHRQKGYETAANTLQRDDFFAYQVASNEYVIGLDFSSSVL
jgi:hypothetical protein